MACQVILSPTETNSLSHVSGRLLLSSLVSLSKCHLDATQRLTDPASKPTRLWTNPSISMSTVTKKAGHVLSLVFTSASTGYLGFQLCLGWSPHVIPPIIPTSLPDDLRSTGSAAENKKIQLENDPGPVLIPDGMWEHEIKWILNEWPQGCRYWYLVRWVGYSPEDDEWLLGRMLRDCEALDQWIESGGSGPTSGQ